MDGLSLYQLVQWRLDPTGSSESKNPLKMKLPLKQAHNIVPSSMQTEGLENLCTYHFGTANCLGHAKPSMYLPGLYNQLQALTKNSEAFLEYSAC